MINTKKKKKAIYFLYFFQQLTVCRHLMPKCLLNQSSQLIKKKPCCSKNYISFLLICFKLLFPFGSKTRSRVNMCDSIKPPFGRCRQAAVCSRHFQNLGSLSDIGVSSIITLSPHCCLFWLVSPCRLLIYCHYSRMDFFLCVSLLLLLLQTAPPAPPSSCFSPSSSEWRVGHGLIN